MTQLIFDNPDRRQLLDTLVEALRITSESGEQPSIEVYGKTFSGYELGKVAAMLPNEEMLPRHQSLIDTMFKKEQRGYFRTASNIVTRMTQIESDQRRRRAMPRINTLQKIIFGDIPASRLFKNRGLSDRTIKALVDCPSISPSVFYLWMKTFYEKYRTSGKLG